MKIESLAGAPTFRFGVGASSNPTLDTGGDVLAAALRTTGCSSGATQATSIVTRHKQAINRVVILTFLGGQLSALARHQRG